MSGLKALKASVNIVDIISRFVTLKKTGRWYIGLCPFHDDHNPSLAVNEQHQTFRCFGCGVSGDVITFLMRLHRVGFEDAVKMLSAESNIDCKDILQQKRRNNKNREILAASAEFYRSLAVSDSQFNSYLAERKVSTATAETLELGITPVSEDNSLVEYLKKHPAAFLKNEILQSGVARKKPDGSLEDFFKDTRRIIFPIKDRVGNVVGLAGRTVDGDMQPKYLNTPFDKSSVVYGEDLLDRIPDSEIQGLIVVEGFFDFIRCYEAFVSGTLPEFIEGFFPVCAMGTVFRPETVERLKSAIKTSGIPSLVFAFDRDEAGRKALLRAVQSAIHEHFNCYVLLWEDGKDIDEALLKQSEMKKVHFVEYFASQGMYEVLRTAVSSIKTLERKKTVADLCSMYTSIPSDEFFMPSRGKKQVAKERQFPVPMVTNGYAYLIGAGIVHYGVDKMMSVGLTDEIVEAVVEEGNPWVHLVIALIKETGNVSEAIARLRSGEESECVVNLLAEFSVSEPPPGKMIMQAVRYYQRKAILKKSGIYR